MSQMHVPKFDDEAKGSRWSITITPLGARIVSLAALVVSIVVMKTNDITFTKRSYQVTVDYKFIRAYKYVLFSMVVGFAYTVMHIPFAIYYFKTGKRLINHYAFLLFEFYGDKVCSFLLAIGVGAIFGVTSELKRNEDRLKDDDQTKYDNFFNKAYISSGFLLIAFIGSAVSSIKSSFAVSRNG